MMVVISRKDAIERVEKHINKVITDFEEVKRILGEMK